jgi:hypothetical protein
MICSGLCTEIHIVFEPGDIIDPSEKFLEAKETSATLDPADRRRRFDRAFWLAGSVVYAVSTLILVIGLGPWGGREPVSPGTSQSASHQATQTALQPRPAERPPTDSSLAQSPQAPHPNAGSAVQTAQSQIGQTPAPGPTSGQLAKANSAAEPSGVTSSKPLIESEQKVPPVVDPAQVHPAPEATAEERVRVTLAASIHTRPSNSADIVGAAYPGAEAVVASRESDWVQIVDPVSGKTGWIHSAFLAPSTEDAASTEAGLQGFEVPDEGARSATVEPKPRAKAKKYRSKRHYGRRAIRLQVRVEARPMIGSNAPMGTAASSQFSVSSTVCKQRKTRKWSRRCLLSISFVLL